jgi:hypothetical protein
MALLPWKELDDSPKDMISRYLVRQFDIGDYHLKFNEEELCRCICKYTRVIHNAVTLYRQLIHLFSSDNFEFEISVDEAASATSVHEHLFISEELKRLDVKWTSLAPRFIGRFEKGVDYIGDLDLFADNFKQHFAIAQTIGPYKLSLHSGSDKFSIFPIVARYAGELLHVKTSGTSYLEALRTIAKTSPALFRKIFEYSRECYDDAKVSYIISANLDKVPMQNYLSDEELIPLLDNFDCRQVLHVTYGPILDKFGPQIREILESDEENYYEGIKSHFLRHLLPLTEQ